jgi:transcriptional regulator with XRE-family HTH domain
MADALIRIGLGIRDYRRAHGLTQQQLERLSGVDQTTISRLENGLAPGLRLERLARIGTALPPVGPAWAGFPFAEGSVLGIGAF